MKIKLLLPFRFISAQIVLDNSILIELCVYNIRIKMLLYKRCIYHWPETHAMKKKGGVLSPIANSLMTFSRKKPIQAWH